MLNNHCCELIEKFLRDDQVPIEYSSKVREYSFTLKNKPGIAQGFDYCPWCGTKLPNSLRQEYFDILRTEFLITDPFEAIQKNMVPEEFKSDAWWKKRRID